MNQSTAQYQIVHSFTHYPLEQYQPHFLLLIPLSLKSTSYLLFQTWVQSTYLLFYYHHWFFKLRLSGILLRIICHLPSKKTKMTFTVNFLLSLINLLPRVDPFNKGYLTLHSYYIFCIIRDVAIVIYTDFYSLSLFSKEKPIPFFSSSYWPCIIIIYINYVCFSIVSIHGYV